MTNYKENINCAKGFKIEDKTYKESDVPRVEQDPYTSCENNKKMYQTEMARAITRERTLFVSGNSPSVSFGLDKLGKPIRHPPGKPRLCLNTNLNSFKRAKCNIGNDLSGSRTSKVDEGLVFGSELRSSKIGVVLLKELVKSKLASTLSTVTQQSRNPSTEKAFDSLFLQQNPKTRRDALVLGRINLVSNVITSRPKMNPSTNTNVK